MGDIALKRELQILLDKFKVLHDTDEMYTEKVPLNDDEVMFYTQKAKLILSLLVRKLGSICVGKIQADGRKPSETHKFIKKIQLLIDVM